MAIVVSKRHTTNPSTRLQFILVQVHGEGPLVTMYHLCWMVTCEAKHLLKRWCPFAENFEVQVAMAEKEIHMGEQSATILRGLCWFAVAEKKS